MGKPPLTHHSLLEALITLKHQRYFHNRLHNTSTLPNSNFGLPHSGAGFRLVGGTELPETPRRILGIAAFYHDSSSAVVENGRVVAAAQEERFSRHKHDARFPRQAISFCLAQADLTMEDIDLVAFYEEPFLKVDRLVHSLIASPPYDRKVFRSSQMDHLYRSISLQLGLKKVLRYAGPICFIQHHLSHAASAFYLSPFSEAACLVVDGVGEWATTSLAIASSQGIKLLEQIDYPHSLGLLYSALTAYLGFSVNNDEYKVMALAAYGKPTYQDKIRKLIHVFSDGSFALDMKYFSFLWDNEHLFDNSLTEFLGIPPRPPQAPITKEHRNLASSLQLITEEVILALLHRLHLQTNLPNLIMGGGVALNCVANYKAIQASPFEDVFIQPAAGDAGGSIGAALYAYHHLASQPPEPNANSPFDPFLGPEFEQAEVESFLSNQGIPYQTLSWNDLLQNVSRSLQEGKVVGWFQGRMEFGPRALGARSILASPHSVDMRDIINQKIKFRESFRPFAPALPEEDAYSYFAVRKRYSPMYYMLFVLPILTNIASEIPSAVHIDRTARPQLVSKQMSARFHSLLRAFEQVSGIPVLLNTSFNLSGEPIVCTPYDAYKTFSYSDMDLLVMECCLVNRESV